MVCSTGIFKTYRIIIYYESDQGPMPLGLAISNMFESSYSKIVNNIRNVEAEQQVLLGDGTFVNTESEMCRIENENRCTELDHSDIVDLAKTSKIPAAITHPTLTSSHIFNPDLHPVSKKPPEFVTKLKDSNYVPERFGQCERANVKQTSILEFIT